ncbi:DUF1810 family protein [Sinorhizobium meliloti]|nr:DUF1810 family protein [Sinorhizobium meliloti]
MRFFGSPDDLKFRSSMTLFREAAAEDGQRFRLAAFLCRRTRSSYLYRRRQLAAASHRGHQIARTPSAFDFPVLRS